MTKGVAVTMGAIVTTSELRIKKARRLMRAVLSNESLRFGFGFQHFFATVKTSRANVVAQVGFARGGLHSNAWHGQSIV